MSTYVVLVVILDVDTHKSWWPTKKEHRNKTKVFGPFDTFEEAESFADKNHCDDWWNIQEVIAPPT